MNSDASSLSIRAWPGGCKDDHWPSQVALVPLPLARGQWGDLRGLRVSWLWRPHSREQEETLGIQETRLPDLS
ncbi:hypothetical protein [Stieleria varia]|uniref:hypothetical protein n=1 Tax=Stieleria varia TaxID=2528005 RepID=UPI0011B7FA51|nr:hypothetical protein [Stieleria varia]